MDTLKSSTTDQSKTQSDGKHSRIVRIARATGQVSGASVLIKDAKRIRPRYPNMWRDLASPQKWREALTHKSASKQPLGTAIYTVALSWLVGMGVILYTVTFLNNPEWIANAPHSSKLALLVLVALAGLQIVTYTTIFGIKLKRMSAPQSRDKRPDNKETQKCR